MVSLEPLNGLVLSILCLTYYAYFNRDWIVNIIVCVAYLWGLSLGYTPWGKN